MSIASSLPWSLSAPEGQRTCYWVKLTHEEVAARKAENEKRQAQGEEVYKARKTKTPRVSKQPKSAAVVESSSDSGSNDGSDDSSDDGLDA